MDHLTITGSSGTRSTRQLLEKVPNVPCLYRHTVTKVYYAIKKLGKKQRSYCLKTADRKIADRRLSDWLRSLTAVNRELERATLSELLALYVKGNAGKSDATHQRSIGLVATFRRTWSYGLDLEVRNVRPSQLDDWLAQHGRRMKNTTYNTYAGFLKQMFAIAVKDRMIVDSPFAAVTTRWKRPQKPVRVIPTIQEFEAIVACIRSQPFTDHAEDTANFIEFLGLAGLGQAEACALVWGDVDWEREHIRVRRRKTDTRFVVPIYPHLRPFMDKLRLKAGKDSPSDRVLSIKDGKKALTSACRKLNLPHFSQRNIRQSLIRRLWQAGVDRKMIAKWQGHIDGGVLILDTYTEVFGSDDEIYERQQLFKLMPPQNLLGAPVAAIEFPIDGEESVSGGQRTA